MDVPEFRLYFAVTFAFAVMSDTVPFENVTVFVRLLASVAFESFISGFRPDFCIALSPFLIESWAAFYV